jgi:hypothetical protein
MYGRAYTSRVSASRGSSRARAKTAKQQTVVSHHPSDFQCNFHDCNASFGRQSGLRRHKESIHRPKQQCPLDQDGYKTVEADGMIEQNLNSLQSKCASSWTFGIPRLTILLGPNFQNSASSTESQNSRYKTQGQDVFNQTDRIDSDGLSNFDGIDSYNDSSSSQIQSSYGTSYSSFTFSDDIANDDNSMISYANASTYLKGIGKWIEDSSSGSAWTAWQSPEALNEHASRFNIAHVKRKPHVLEAMDCFQVSFYGVGAAAA